MHQKTSKRRMRAQLVFVYSLMTLAVIVSAAVLVLAVLGYRFNRFDGRIEQGGLVQFDSTPDGAAVTLDQVRLANRTPSKITATAGDHTITMQRDGYTTWQKNVVIKPGSVLWLNYARMLPLVPKTTEVGLASELTSTAIDKDKKQLAAVAVASDPMIYLTDLNADKLAFKKLVIQGYTAAQDPMAQQFSVVSWSNDGRMLLVKHAYDGRSEFLSVDSRGDSLPINISSLLGVDILTAMYSYDNNKQVYLVTANHELRLADLGAKTLSGPLLTNVKSVGLFDRGTITYETLPDAAGARQIGYLTVGASKPRIVMTVTGDETTPLKLSLGRYYNRNYAVIVRGGMAEILSGSLPASDTAAGPDWKRVALLTVPTGTDIVGFSPDQNRFVYLQKAGDITVYDLELSTISHNTLAPTLARPVDWLDGYHYATSAGGEAKFWDFDGTNQLVVATKNTIDEPTAISQDDRYLYHFERRETGVVLVRTEL